MLIAPLSKDAGSKSGAASLRSYSNKLSRAIDDMTPWTHEGKFSSLRRKYGRAMREAGEEVIVLLDVGDSPDDPLYEDATTMRDTRRKAED